MTSICRDNTYISYNFLMSITGAGSHRTPMQAAFMEVTGLEQTVSPIVYREGHDNSEAQQLVGPNGMASITFKRGVSSDPAFYNWIVNARNGEIRRVDGSVVLFSEDRQVVMHWHFSRGWPSQYSGPGFNATDNAIAIETLQICHEGLTID